MSTRTLAVVSGGLRQPSTTRLLADRLTEATVRALGEQGITTTVEVVELREHAHDLTNMLLTGFAVPRLQEVLDAVVGADGLIAVSPIFSGSYNGLFKTFFDVLEAGSLAGMPTLLGATAGTARHSLALDHALRPLFVYQRAVVVPTGVFGATEDFGASSSTATGRADDTPAIAVRVDRAARELAPLVAARTARAGRDAFTDPTPFERLLAGGA
ncbi:NADPH-dependent FMN reductase [Actinotalea ferrariae CF5-4]|uniref:NADPH-dependent FMN reductase n=1 Tax=Actinotalea ferrariae CF5-4 TaxID=948458 RepID=A0A021VX79_9CELL|nr:FMN reductase [Actinotalea ferrariae]EYR63687.1 NADPH-dependent FMN reductase [Actinotalea ferrariae CF5-4]